MESNDFPPYIKIGNGSRKFYINLCKAYLKNHKQIHVIGGGYKIQIALEVYMGLRKDFCVFGLQHICLLYNRMHSMCVFSVKEGVTDIEPSIQNFDNDISINDKETISELTSSSVQKLYTKKEINVVAVGVCAVKAFFLASQLSQKGFFTYIYPLCILKNDEFLIKIKVYKPFLY